MRSRIEIPCLFAMLLTLAACGSGQTTTARDAAIGEAALTGGNAEAALRLADEALTRNPRDADSLTRRGIALTALGRLNEARDSLMQSVSISPGQVRSLLALGRVQLPVDPAAAAVSFEAVLKTDRHNAAALNDLGIARDLMGQHVDAEADYRDALDAQPGMTAAKVNLALCLAMRGIANEAIELLRPIAAAPDASRKVKEDYAAVLAMAGDRASAEQILSTTLSEHELSGALDTLAFARGARTTVMR